MTLHEDLKEIISDENIPWERLENTTILITGATGLIGSAIVRALFAAGEKHKFKIRIIALGRNEQKGEQLEQKYNASFYKHDLTKPITLTESVDYIFHCAAVTSSAEMVSNPVGVIETALKGTENILEFAREKQIKSMVYLSSMEVYGVVNKQFVTENDLGYIDLPNPRSSYPESKRMCELMCNCYFSQYQIPVKIARLAQAFGARTPKDDKRVFAQFARSAVSGTDIELHTEGKSRGNYCYISDAIRGLFTILFKGENGQAYNVANASATIKEMAEIVANDVCGGEIKVIVNVPKDIEKRGYAPDVGYKLSADKLIALGWKPKYGLYDMYKRMIADWQEQ